MPHETSPVMKTADTPHETTTPEKRHMKQPGETSHETMTRMTLDAKQPPTNVTSSDTEKNITRNND